MGWIEDEVMPTIWVIRVKKTSTFSGCIKTGFCLKNNRILTCYHGFENENEPIMARMIHEDGFNHKMKIVYKREDWDLALLEFEVYPGHKFEHLELSKDEVLTVDDKIHTIGISGLPGQFASGLILKPCVDIDPSTFKDPIQNCEAPKEEVCYTRHALMMDIQYINRKVDKNYLNRHPYLPLIIVRMTTDYGFSGGPFFRDDCKIAGIGIISNGWNAIGLHLSVLKLFLKEADENVFGASTSN